MIIYSEKIVYFLEKITTSLKDILSSEVKLKVRGNRFYNRGQTHSYPIKIVIYNDGEKLGYFDPNFFELGFQESVLSWPFEKLRDLIRHELAHYLTYIEYGDIAKPHGAEYRDICNQHGWGKSVYAATMPPKLATTAKEEATLRRVQKLLALGSSSNEHEATLALLKSRELLLKHNLDHIPKNNNQVFLKRILKVKRRNTKIEAIAHILETFFVTTVYNQTSNYTYLEILGSKVNIEIAEYIANTLEHELDNLWKKTDLKGLAAKNSFFYGIAKGYCEKVESLQEKNNLSYSRALIVIENKLEAAKKMAYGKLSSTRSERKHHAKADRLGRAAGKSLNLKQGLYNKNKETKFIGY